MWIVTFCIEDVLKFAFTTKPNQNDQNKTREEMRREEKRREENRTEQNRTEGKTKQKRNKKQKTRQIEEKQNKAKQNKTKNNWKQHQKSLTVVQNEVKNILKRIVPLCILAPRIKMN